MKKKSTTALLFLLFLACSFSFCFAEESFFSINNGTPEFSSNPWFDYKLSQVETQLTNAGYNQDPISMLYRSFGIIIYKNSYTAPHTITLLSENNIVTSASLTYNADKQLFQDLESSITSIAGEPTHTKEYTETFNNYTETHGESLTWSYSGYTYKINGDGNQKTLSKIAQIRSGSHPFILTVQRDEGSSKLTEKIEDVKPAAGLQSSSKKNASTSTSSNKTKSSTQTLDVEVGSVRIEKDSIGNPKLYIRFKNNSSTKTIDRLDFAVKCYDVYGNEIKPYGFYTHTDCFFEEKTISPKKSSPTDWSWTIYGVEGTRSVKIAITKYHTTDGNTVIVPESEYRWKKF